MGAYIDIVFDGPPSHESGRFVEVEDQKGYSIARGEWVQRDDGYWVLRLPDPAEVDRLMSCLADRDMDEARLQATAEADVERWKVNANNALMGREEARAEVKRLREAIANYLDDAIDAKALRHA